MMSPCTRSMSRATPSGAASGGPRPLREVDMWLERFRRFWAQRLDALATELARGTRERRAADPAATGTTTTADSDDEEGT